MKLSSFVDMFDNYDDADTWLDGHLEDHDPEHWTLRDIDVKLMESGMYRAGIVFESNQIDFNFDELFNG